MPDFDGVGVPDTDLSIEPALPVQLFDPAPVSTPECELWSGLFQQAVDDLAGRASAGILNGSPAHRKIQENARAWIVNNRWRGIGSFVWVCGVLGLDVGAARAFLLTMEGISDGKGERTTAN